MRRLPVRRSALLVAAGLCAVGAATSTAQACLEVFGQEVSESDRRPSLDYEQTLIVYDAEKRREHFVREVVFSASREPFGFVVPTPSRPEVAKIKKSPFARLREEFPFRRPHRERVARLAAAGMGDSVEVLEVTRVGRFTAFVLSASDAAGLSRWLSQNGFVRTPEVDAWLAHYVKLGFFYVAMRYEPARGDKGKTTAETIRISFDSPLPYYPYREPAAGAGKVPAKPRLLEIWLASTRDFVPVVSRASDAADGVRPFLDGSLYASASVRSTLAAAVDAELLPAGPLRLQRFADQKRSRAGFGDVVFVPASAADSGPPAETLRAFAETLDPAHARPPAATADLMAGRTPASKLPVVATEGGRRFDPYLRDRVAPIRRREHTTIDLIRGAPPAPRGLEVDDIGRPPR